MSATSRGANINLTFAITTDSGGTSDLTGTMETQGTVQVAYGDRSSKFVLSAAGQGETVFGDTANPYGWTFVYVSEGEIHNRMRWVLEAIQDDTTAGTYTNDIVITMWDGQGDSPFTDDPTITYEAEQTFNTDGTVFDINSARWAVIPATPRPAFDAAFKPDSDDKFLEPVHHAEGTGTGSSCSWPGQRPLQERIPRQSRCRLHLSREARLRLR